MRLFDLDTARAEALASQLRRLSPATEITVGPPGIDDIDVLLNATPVGMLGDTRMAIEVQPFPEQMIVFDAIVMPEQTPLLAHAERHGCRTVRGREMMRGQIAKIVDFFIATRRGAT
jgi:shikimate dehydrogenase